MPVPHDDSSALQQYAQPDRLVTTQWLAANLDNPDLVVVESDEDVLLYDTGHIPGSIKVDWHLDLNDPVTRDYVDGEGFARLCSKNGIGRDSTVVFYGDNFNWWAAYALWVFTLFGHADVKNPDEVATPESFDAVMALSKYHAANLDIGHYTEAGYDPVAFIQKNHGRISNLHLKDKKTAAHGGQNGPWGTGDTPIKDCLKLLQKNKWDLPSNIEFEYDGDPVTEVAKCLQLCRDYLA